MFLVFGFCFRRSSARGTAAVTNDRRRHRKIERTVRGSREK
jgi:hypothetical protein